MSAGSNAGPDAGSGVGPDAGPDAGSDAGSDADSGPLELLGQSPLLEGFTHDELAAVAAGSHPVSVPAGHLVMEEGTPGDGLYLVLRGDLEVVRRDGTTDVAVERLGPGTFLGETALLAPALRTASVRTLTDAELLRVAPEVVLQVLERRPVAALDLVRTMLSRLRAMEAAMIDNARLSALGTLAAGLAHELNNPLAALQAGLPRLSRAVEVLAEGQEVAPPPGTGPDAPAAGLPAGPLARAEAEDRVAAWMAARGVQDVHVLSAPLVTAGWTAQALEERFAGHAPGAEEASSGTALETRLRRLAAASEARAIMAELGESARAIARTVAAVRGHAAPPPPDPGRHYDPVEGIRAALTLLRSRIPAGVEVRVTAPDEPVRIPGLGPELSHVWTNVLDNALAAAAPRGRVEIDVSVEADPDAAERSDPATPPRTEVPRTVAGGTMASRTGSGRTMVRRTAAGRTVIRITDSGPGIAPEVLPRIFEPFFSTRADRGGMGLGLHIARRTLARVGGRIEARSRPGRTVFTVTLPPPSPAEPSP